MTDGLLQDILTAEHGSRELDVRFWCAFHGLTGEIEYGEDEGAGRQWFTCGLVCQFMDELPRYTTNLQDTLEAVPKNLRVSHMAWDKDGAVVILGPYRAPDFEPVDAKDPRLALCAAILQAKGAQDGS